MSRFPSLVVLAVGTCLALSAAPAHAQVGMGTDIITGVVTGADGAPLQDATVEAYSLETQITRRARTDERGRYTILFPDGGGQYRMTARVIGYSPRAVLLMRDADEDRLVWNVRLAEGAVSLEAITVRAAPSVQQGRDAPTPGSIERAFNPDVVARIPLDATDLTMLAALAPGVLMIAATESTATAFSVAGLGTDANALTLDGLLFGTSSVPQEGLRQTRVVTSTYDVSRGQFSGGLIASTTRGGSNVVQGSSQAQVRDEDLAVNPGETPYTQGFTQNVFSGGIGGPIVRDRVFVFGSLQSRMRSDPQQTLLSASAADYSRLGVNPDSVTRFLDIVNGLGVPPRSVASGATRASDNLSGMVRLDVVLSNAHSLTLRGDWRGNSQDPARLGPLALPQTGGQTTGSGGGVMATLSSRFGAAVLNEFRGYYQSSKNDGDPYSQLPQGRVQIASQLSDSTRGVTTLVFGGNAGMPTRSDRSSFEASDELSWLPGSGAHRIKLGASYLTERSRDLVGGNLLGSFTYNSLADLEAGRAASFRRTLNATERRADNERWGVFAGDVWMVSRPFQLTYGVRLEGSRFGDAPAYNPAVDSVFGRRTDLLPSEWHVSPRAGFTWTLGTLRLPGGGMGGAGERGGRGFAPATTVIRGGFGEFRSQPSSGMAAQARSATGLTQSAAEVYCAGSAVPAPAWDQYWADPNTIPEECLTGGSLPPGGFQAARTVTVLAPGFQAPRAWRGSLGVERRLTPLLRLTFDGSYSLGVAQTGYRDLNFAGTQRFVLVDEGGRPVFVGVNDITPTTGTPSFAASRVDSVFGSVLEAQSNLRSQSVQFSAGLSGIVGRGISFQLSYTWQRARAQESGSRGGTTAGDPNLIEWGRNDRERRHSILATLTYPLGQTMEITSIGRFSSGSPYTPMVGGDVNGDGSRNDRAFIFAPGTATAEAQGMARLLAEASPAVRSCLEGQVGSVAERNSCSGPWQASLDFQLNWRPALLGLNRRLTVSVITYNFLRGLDELLHGESGAKGWGLNTRPDNTLLYVSGFDPLAQRYAYQVNERFGATGGSATAFRPPFQVGIQARLQIGPDRQRAAMDAMRAGGGRAGGGGMGGPGGGFGGFGGPGGMRGGGGSAAEIIRRIDSVLPNPAGVVLGMRDSLRLDSGQVVLLGLLRDSLERRKTFLLDSLRRTVERAGENPDVMSLMPVLRPLFQSAREETSAALVSVRAVLSEEQWAMVPETVKAVRIGPMPGRRPGGPGRPGGPPPDER